MNRINVLHLMCPAGLYGAEMWTLALAGNMDRRYVNCSLAVTHEEKEQNIDVLHRFRELGLGGYRIRMRGRFDPASVTRLLRLIREKEIHIVHTHGYKSDILGLMAGRAAGALCVSTPHGFENHMGFKLRLFMEAGCLFLKGYDRVAPLSHALAADMDRMGIDPSRVVTIRNGVDLSEIETVVNGQRRSPPQARRVKRIGYVGQIARRKNVWDLIRTFDLLHAERENVRLILVGDGPMRRGLERRAARLQSAAAIEFTGYRKDRLSIVKELDLFSMTSSLEGIPRCMMEAMAMGIPSAGFDIPGVDDLIIHGKTGLMAPFGDVAKLRDCWKALLFDEKLKKRVSEGGRRHIVRNFSGGRMAGDYLALYRSLARDAGVFMPGKGGG